MLNFSMVLKKVSLWIILFMILFGISNAVGVFNQNGNFIFYTNSINPKINISIYSASEDIYILNPIVQINTKRYNLSLPNSTSFGYPLNFMQNKNFSFQLNYNLTSQDNITFNLKTISQNTGNPVETKGDPTNFRIIIDKTMPELISPLININKNFILKGKNPTQKLEFNKKIRTLEFIINGKIIYNKIFNFKSFKDYNTTFNFNFSSTSKILKEGNNPIKLIFSDLAGNYNELSLNISYFSVPLNITIVTKAQNSSLNYFYSKKYKTFLNNEIYITQLPFNLIIKTNKPANCYFINDLTQFKPYDEIKSKSQPKFTSKEGITHLFNVNNLKNNYVVCVNKILSSDISYFSSSVLGIGNSLFNFNLDKSKPKFDGIFPNSLITSNSFNIFIKTNKPTICNYSLNNKQSSLISKENYTTHISTILNLPQKKYSILYSCFDKEYNIISKDISFEVNSSKGVQITNWSPKYTNKTNIKINLSLSQNANCKFSKIQVANSYFSNLTSINKTENQYSFQSGNLNNGNNYFYIYCENSSQISLSKISVIYSKTGPIINNILFTNSNSKYIKSLSNFGIKINYTSKIPIKFFRILIFRNSSKILLNKTFSSNIIHFSNDLTNATIIKVYAVNSLEIKGNEIEKNIFIDNTSPEYSCEITSNQVKISCLDSNSGCSKYFYGFSNTVFCNANILYNSSITIGKSNYICVKGSDNAGNIGEKSCQISNFKLLNGTFSIPNNSISNISNNISNFTMNNNLINNQSNNSLNPIVPIQTNSTYSKQNNTTSPITYSLFAAFALFLAAAGGSGYYAYKKGYLDEQLKKFGVNRNQKGSSNQKNTSKVFFTSQTKNLEKRKTGKYDIHLKKLNKFIDEKIKSSNSVFDKFSSTKGKTKDYEDTLIKGNIKKRNNKNIEFDDFYQSSKSTKETSFKVKDIKAEAESFEEFHKNKKIKK